MKLHLASSFPQKFIAIVCKSVYMDVYKCTNVSNVWSLLNPNTCADLSHPLGILKDRTPSTLMATSNGHRLNLCFAIAVK